MLTALLSHTATAQSAIAAAQTVDIKKRCFVKASPRLRYGRKLRPGSQVWQARGKLPANCAGHVSGALGAVDKNVNTPPPGLFL